MKKTNKMAVIGQLNPMTGKYTHIERRVYEDEAGNKYVRINGDFTDIDWLIMHDRRVHIYF